MRFPQETREAIHAAKGKAVEIDWPIGLFDPKIGHGYSVQSSHRAGEIHVVVLARDKICEGQWKALVKVDGDPVRLLRMKSFKPLEAEPMGGPQFAPEHEPERISVEEEAAITRAAHRKRREAVEGKIDEADEALRVLQQSGEAESLAGDLRFLRTRLARMKAKAGGEEAADRAAA